MILSSMLIAIATDDQAKILLENYCRRDSPIGSSLPMIGDWDTGRQPAVALREPMA
jgi:hypothetical protein